MLELFYSDIYPFAPFIINFLTYWAIFFKLNFFSIQQNLNFLDKVKSIPNKIRNIHYIFFVKLNFMYILIILIFFIDYHGYIETFWWNHFKLSNMFINVIIVLLIVNFIFVIVVSSLGVNSGVYKIDYFFSLTNLSNFLPLIFIVNTIFTLLFVLEVNSILIFYKFVSSKFWYNTKKPSINNYTFKRLLPKNYLNMLFFQYWGTFFGSSMLMFSVISYLYMYSSTEWTFLNILNKVTIQLSYHHDYINNIIISAILLFAFLIKIGFTPIQLYKLEVYKGIPYLAIFFYTTFYFLVFFLFFILLIIFYYSSFLCYWWYTLLLVLVFGGLYVLNLLFDVNYIKAFFAYSTMVNSLGFICVALSVAL